ncbi:MAG: hypothetical protein M3458_19270 [Acidobacteriota bacterium]|nr:hypothetical protein [Acidobacteriota bacterium]
MAVVLKTLSVILFVCVATCGCSASRTAVDATKLKAVEGVWATLPIYPGMIEVNNSSSSYDDRVWVEKNYKSDAPFDDLKRFYTEKLTQSGWQFVGERELKDRGRFRGEQLLEFRKGSFEIDLQYAGTRKADLGWDYSIDITSP